jgi:hypothetical protein
MGEFIIIAPSIIFDIVLSFDASIRVVLLCISEVLLLFDNFGRFVRVVAWTGTGETLTLLQLKELK